MDADRRGRDTVPNRTRTSLIELIFAGLPRGERLTAAEVAEGLAHHGHDFGGIAADAEARVRLTEPALDRLVARGTLVQGEPVRGASTWLRPAPIATPTPVVGPSVDTPSPQDGPRSASGTLAAAFLVAQLVLGVLILLIGTIHAW